MATYYVGAGGNDAWNGLTWATRKLTLNGAENVPVVAGDTVYVAPGVYREMLTCDVSGGAGSPITYIGDVSGEHTDGVGGVVRVTGSDNDQTATRTNCITATSKNYRVFQGFVLDTVTASNYLVNLSGCTNATLQDCVFMGDNLGISGLNCDGAAQSTILIDRCFFYGSFSRYIVFTHTVAVNNAGHIVRNCLLLGGCTNEAIRLNAVGGVTINGCSFSGVHANAIRVSTALAGGQTETVNNCIFVGCNVALRATVLGEITEDYNSLFGNTADRTLVGVGAHSVAYPALWRPPILLSGYRYPWPVIDSLSDWSTVRAIAGTGMPTADILGMTRPVTDSKKSWGAVQYVDMARDTTTKRTGTASKKFADAGRDQIYVPTTNISTVFSVYVYREANYAGVNPQMIVKQPGQADVVVTDAGAAGAWNQLTTTLTPAALPGYVVVELVSNNTAAAGVYGVYFDDLTVT